MTQWISVAEARRSDAVGRSAEVRGWVRTRRDSKGGFSFVEINDGSSMGGLQVVVPGELPNYDDDIQRLSAGASLVVTGEIVASPASEQATEMRADTFRIVGEADPKTYPLQKKRHSFEKLREWAHLRPRTNTFGAVARVRDRISRSIHDFFGERGFLYLNTPIVTASDCEGAGEMFRVTTLPVGRGGVDDADDFFGRPAYLTVSGQLEAETYATALSRVYTYGPTFRAENSNTSRHLAEFWMVEPEAAFFDLDDDRRLAEDFLKRIFGDVLEHCPEDMAFFDARIEKGKTDQLRRVVETPFRHLTYDDAVAVLEKADVEFEHAPGWGKDLQAEHERYLCERYAEGPVVVTDYPTTIKPFYMRISDDQRTVAAMDVLVPGVGEIIGGSQREERLDVLTDRMRAMDLNPDDYWWYLDLRRFGTVPHAGFGLGLERAVQYATGMTNIRDVIPFPRYPGHAEF